MSQENVEIVRRLYERWTRGDYSGTIEWADPEIEFVVDEATGIDLAGTAHGIEGMARLWRKQLEAWDGFKVEELQEIIGAGDRVVALGRLWGRGRQSGVEVTKPDRGAIFTFRDGKVIRLVLTSGENARDAASPRD